MKKENEQKEYIIKAIRKALLNSNFSDNKGYEYTSEKVSDDADATIDFVDKFVDGKGNIMYSINEDEIKSHLELIVNKYPGSSICCCSNTLSKFFNILGFDYIEEARPNKSYDIGIIPCESIIAQDASILISDGQGYLCMPDRLILFAFTSQSVRTWKDAVERIKSQYNDNLPGQMILIEPNKNKNTQIYLLLTED